VVRSNYPETDPRSSRCGETLRPSDEAVKTVVNFGQALTYADGACASQLGPSITGHDRL